MKRLLEYSAAIIRLVEKIPKTRAANHVDGQMVRCGTFPLFNHGEAQAAESPKDFVHKLRVSLKELRKTQRCLRLIIKVTLIEDHSDIDPLLVETNELIRIFVSIIRPAGENQVREEPGESCNA